MSRKSTHVPSYRLHKSSGHAPLDVAAMSVAEVFRFNPFVRRGEPVPVAVSLPITFRSG